MRQGGDGSTHLGTGNCIADLLISPAENTIICTEFKEVGLAKRISILD